MKIKEFAALYETFCPKELAMENEPVGLQIGDSEAQIQKVLVTLDIREQTVQEAIEIGADLILTKHHVIFRPLSNLTTENPQEKMVLDLVKNNISVYASHTNIDVVSGGLNDWFAELLNLTDVEILTETMENQGIGRIGNITEQTLGEFVETFRHTFDTNQLRLVTYDKSLSQNISRVALCGGSGGKFWKEALKKGADLYITGDIYYHDGHDMLSSNLTALDPGHYWEHLFVTKVAETLRKMTNDIEIIESQVNTNPFWDI